MKPFLLLFSLALLTQPCTFVAQTVTFTPGLKLPFSHAGKLNSTTNSKGDLLVWACPDPANKWEYSFSNKLYRIGSAPGDTSSAGVFIPVAGKTPVPAFNFAFFSGKLYAFGQVLDAKRKSHVLACEINRETLSIIGEPVTVFEVAGVTLDYKAYIDRKVTVKGIPCIQVSEDGSHLLLYAYELPDNKSLFSIRLRLYKSSFSVPIYDKQLPRPVQLLTYVPQEVQLGKSGMLLVTGYGDMIKDTAKAYGLPAYMGYNAYVVMTIGEQTESTIINLGQQYSPSGLRAKFAPDGHVICAGPVVDRTPLGGEWSTKGVYYFSLWPDHSQPSTLKIKPYEIEEQNSSELDHYFIQELIVDSTGWAWLIIQYHFGVNYNDKLGNILVTGFNEDGRLITQHLVYLEKEYSYNPISNDLVPLDDWYFKNFAAFVYQDSLHLLFLDDNRNDATQNVEGKPNAANNTLVEVKIAPDGKLSKTQVAEFETKEVRPSSRLLFPEEIADNKWILTCSDYGTPATFYYGILEVK